MKQTDVSATAHWLNHTTLGVGLTSLLTAVLAGYAHNDRHRCTRAGVPGNPRPFRASGGVARTRCPDPRAQGTPGCCCAAHGVWPRVRLRAHVGHSRRHHRARDSSLAACTHVPQLLAGLPVDPVAWAAGNGLLESARPRISES